MYIEISHVYGLLGGALIGCSALLLMFTLGKVAGISGIIGSVIRLSNELSWQVAFIFGMFITGLVYHWLYQPIEIIQSTSGWQLVIAGLLVGFGTRLGNGCTSGHGVCGMARLSKRSITATIIFMVTAVVSYWLFSQTIN
jgi:uncharacterized protein